MAEVYRKTPNTRKYPRSTMDTQSPIASRQQRRTLKSPTKKGRKPSLVRNLLNRFEEATHSHHPRTPIASKTKKALTTVHDASNTTKKALFSPKYLVTTDLPEQDSGLQSPPCSPLKKRERLDTECRDSVLSIKQHLWSLMEEEMDSFLFMKYAPVIKDDYFANKKPYLPPQRECGMAGKYTLVLDLDETLVHCSVDKVESCDAIFPVTFNGDQYKVYMRKRPFFQEFLETVVKDFEVVIFTASQECYANKLLNLVDPEHKLIHHRLFRTHCINVEGNFVKDLRVLGRDLAKTMIIDNSPPAFTNQVNNGIPIVSWYQDKFDTELMRTIPVLQKLRTLPDVRPAIKKYFMTKKLINTVKM